MKWIGFTILLWLALSFFAIYYDSKNHNNQQELNETIGGAFLLSAVIIFAVWCIWG